MEATRAYLPAAGHDWLLPFYDPFVKLLGGDAARRALLEPAALQPGQRVLEVGCGTGTLVAMIKRGHPGVEVVGLDPDPKGLARAKRKAARERLAIQFNQGFADELPYPDRSFDRVFSFFMFHHLPLNEKLQMLREARRVLKPGGEFHMLDFEGPEDRKHGFLVRLFHSNKHLKDNSQTRVVELMEQAGLLSPEKIGRRKLLFGGIAYYRARA
ncbi:MAG TPA: class I SAM-dependent methyltransferase [Terriglobales bacterium]|nr:class I SAM-dependent methyltransferase [Terriglobales bacterium]